MVFQAFNLHSVCVQFALSLHPGFGASSLRSVCVQFGFRAFRLNFRASKSNFGALMRFAFRLRAVCADLLALHAGIVSRARAGQGVSHQHTRTVIYSLWLQPSA